MSSDNLTARRKHKLAVRATALAVVILFASSARAGIRPSFDYDSATWDATNVVLVEATATPGAWLIRRLTGYRALVSVAAFASGRARRSGSDTWICSDLTCPVTSVTGNLEQG